MTHPAYLREKAISMRVENGMTMDEIAERLALSRSTIYYWVRAIPIDRKPGGFSDAVRRKGNAAMREKYLRIRELAYNSGRHSFHALADYDPTFRDFICLYIGEGYKRTRHVVSVANSDPLVIEFAHRWIRVLSSKSVTFSLQYHADQNPDHLIAFWCNRLGVSPSQVKCIRKSNSGQLEGRVWRNQFGVLAVTVNDTELRARVQGWIDEMKKQWLDSIRSGA